jgi:Tol biopolymer transport system component
MFIFWTRGISLIGFYLSVGAALLVGVMCMGVAGSGGQIAFDSNRNGNWDIYLLDVRTAIVHNLTYSPEDDLQPAWSGQLDEIAFYSSRESAGIYAMGIYDKQVRPLKTGSRQFWRPAWSPDASQFVFMFNYNEIRVADTRTQAEHELTFGFSPVWSPVKQQIAYYSDRPGMLQTDIYVVNSDGSNPRNLDNGLYSDWDPAWSPDGRQIAFISSRSGNAEIYVVDVECTACQARQLTFTAEEELLPAWSPDGQQIAFVAKVSGFSHVYIMNIDGTGRYPLTSGANDNRYPAWRP